MCQMTHELRQELEASCAAAIKHKHLWTRVHALADLAARIHAAGDAAWTAQVLAGAMAVKMPPETTHIELAEAYLKLLGDRDAAIMAYKSLLSRTRSSVLCCLISRSVKSTLADEVDLIKRALKRAERLGGHFGEGADYCSHDDFEEEDSWFAYLAKAMLLTLGDVPWTRRVLVRGLEYDKYTEHLWDVCFVTNLLPSTKHQREVYIKGFRNRIADGCGKLLVDDALKVISVVKKSSNHMAALLHNELLTKITQKDEITAEADLEALDHLAGIEKDAITPCSQAIATK